MEAAERLEMIARQGHPYPESLITAICHYAAGEGSLSTVQQEWQKAGIRVISGHPFFLVFSYVNAKQRGHNNFVS